MLVKSRPIVVTNPPDDAGFAAAIEAELNRGDLDAAQLEQRLRIAYPRAVVRPRSLTGELVEVWYAYREGKWAAPGERQAESSS